MANEAEEARALATRLFARAHRAREQGHLSFAEVLSASAQRSLDNAMALGAALAPVPKTRQQPAVQHNKFNRAKALAEKQNLPISESSEFTDLNLLLRVVEKALYGDLVGSLGSTASSSRPPAHSEATARYPPRLSGSGIARDLAESDVRECFS